MLAKPNAILFDLDGTLLDTAKDLGHALNHVLTQKSQPTISFEKYRNIASDGAKGLLELGFSDKLKNYDFLELRQQLLDHYEQNICVDTCFFEGIESLLTTLNELKIPWGIVTNKPEFLTLQLVKYFPLLENCHVVISGDTLTERKPHPLPLLHAEKQLNLVNPNTWYVGDALRDIQAAQAANMVSVIAEYGYIDQGIDTRDWNADISVQLASDILTFL